MNPLRQFKQVVSNLKLKIRNRFSKTLGIKTVGDYKLEIKTMLDDLAIISDFDTIDELVDQMGIQGVAQEYININKYYKEYYQHIIREVQKAENTSNEFKNYARAAEAKWEKTYKEIIQYLYDKKYEMMYGKNENFEEGYALPEEVKTYHANSFADQELPWLRKEDLNDNYNNDFYRGPNFNEGLKGLSIGTMGGVAVAIAASSLSATFHLHPRMFTGLSTALGAIVGHFIQKHFFIDFTNYVKLKRYITHYPEAFEHICDLMAKNAVKFQQKDPVKYKKILMNLKRLQQNPPEIYKNYLDDEIENEQRQFDTDTFVTYDADGNPVNVTGAVDPNDWGNSGISNDYNSSSRISRRPDRDLRSRSRERLARSTRDLDFRPSMSNKDLEIKAKDLLGEID